MFDHYNSGFAEQDSRAVLKDCSEFQIKTNSHEKYKNHNADSKI
jgi:hypothetical protein